LEMPTAALMAMLARKNKADIARMTRYLRFMYLVLRIGGFK
jgi:hypothetical protein